MGWHRELGCLTPAASSGLVGAPPCFRHEDTEADTASHTRVGGLVHHTAGGLSLLQTPRVELCQGPAGLWSVSLVHLRPSHHPTA